MREKLKHLCGTSGVFVGRVATFGHRVERRRGRVRRVNTLLLTDVCDTRKNGLTRHAWVNMTRDLYEAKLKRRDHIIFTADVRLYRRDGLDLSRPDAQDRSHDYGFSEVRKVSLLNRPTRKNDSHVSKKGHYEPDEQL